MDVTYWDPIAWQPVTETNVKMPFLKFILYPWYGEPSQICPCTATFALLLRPVP